jgi:Rieske Fe-S protein
VQVTRRDLLRGTAALAGGSCLCAASTARPTCCITPDIEPGSVTFSEGCILIDLEKARSIAEIGASANLIDPERKLDLIIVRPDRHRYCALSGLCTHFPRPLTYVPARRMLQCNNFNHSIFDLAGNVVKGPAPKPIRAFPVTVEGNALKISL